MQPVRATYIYRTGVNVQIWSLDNGITLSPFLMLLCEGVTYKLLQNIYIVAAAGEFVFWFPQPLARIYIFHLLRRLQPITFAPTRCAILPLCQHIRGSNGSVLRDQALRSGDHHLCTQIIRPPLTTSINELTLMRLSLTIASSWTHDGELVKDGVILAHCQRSESSIFFGPFHGQGVKEKITEYNVANHNSVFTHMTHLQVNELWD